MNTISAVINPVLTFSGAILKNRGARFRHYLGECSDVKWLTMTDGILKILLVVGAIWFGSFGVGFWPYGGD